MKKQTSIQQALKTAFPEFNDKKLLIDYYVSFEFPERQMRMVNWWQKVIQFIIEQENKAFITYQELVSFLTVYNLKPTPLQSIINYLAKKDIVVPENQYEIKQANKQSSTQNKTSLFNTFLSYVYKPTVKEISLFKFTPAQKIYSKKIKEFKKHQIKKVFHTLFKQHVKAISLHKLIEQLQHQVQLDRDSLLEILKQLHKDNSISLCQNNTQLFVLYSHNSTDLSNKEWIDLERMKFCLREQIQTFQFMISRQQQKISKLKERAKEQIERKQQKTAHATCREITEKHKKIENISTRKNILQNQITQLEYNQMNKTTMTLLQQAHAVYEQTMIDQSKLDDIVQKNMEIEVSNKQVNQKIESLVSKEDYDEDVDEMMKALQKQIMKQPQKQKIKVEIPMDIDHGVVNKVKQQQKRKMDIEGYKP